MIKIVDNYIGKVDNNYTLKQLDKEVLKRYESKSVKHPKELVINLSDYSDEKYPNNTFPTSA